MILISPLIFTIIMNLAILFIMILSGVSDFLDGFLARKYNLTTSRKDSDPIGIRYNHFHSSNSYISSEFIHSMLIRIYYCQRDMVRVQGLHLPWAISSQPKASLIKWQQHYR